MPENSPLVPSWMRAYPGGALRPDVMAGLITAAVVIPKAMAYASIAGLPVEVGIYTVFVPMAIYAVLGSSRPLSVSTTTTIAILTGSAIGQVAPSGDLTQIVVVAVTLAFMVGVLLVIASFLKLGFFSNYISEPVLTGFKAGIGIMIVVDQLPKLLGVHFEKGAFLDNVAAIFQHLPQTSVATLLVAVVTILAVVILIRFAPRWPAPLIAVAGAIVVSYFFGFSEQGIKTIGTIPQGMPSVTLPTLSLLGQVWPAALGIALMSFVETIAVARAFVKSPEPAPDPNRELFATGVANIGGAFLSCMPGGGGASQTAVNRMAGAHTQVATLVTASMAVATMLLLAPALGFMPQATLAAVVIIYSVELIQIREFRAIYRIRQVEFWWAVIAFSGVLVLGTLEGIIVAIVVSLIDVLKLSTNPDVYALARNRSTQQFEPVSGSNDDQETAPGLLLVRVEGQFFFANTQIIGDKTDQLMDQFKPRVVAFDLSRVFDIEYSAIKMLIEDEARLRKEGIRIWLVKPNPRVRQILARSPLADLLEEGCFHERLSDAFEHYKKTGMIGNGR